MTQNFQHGGNIHKLARETGLSPENILDFSASINPLGFPDWMQTKTIQLLKKVEHYPDPEAHALLAAASARYQLPCSELLAANGSTEILYHLPRVCTQFARAIIPVPSYVDYEKVCSLHHLHIQHLQLREAENFTLLPQNLRQVLQDPALVFLGHPNNPSGNPVLSAAEIRQLALEHPRSLFVLDEAFADFLPDQERLYACRLENILILLSLTKFYAIPGLRLGLAAGPPGLINQLQHIIPPWSVNSLAQELGVLALQDTSYQQQTRELTCSLKLELQQMLQELPGLQVFPSAANFLLCRLSPGYPRAPQLRAELIKQGLLIRDCSNFQGLDHSFFRVAIRAEQENQKLVHALGQALGSADTKSIGRAPTPSRISKKTNAPTPALMLQGTSSNAGKSILATALCRILLQDGYQPAPFKAQNMSLNSFVTKQGGEMGRAQVLQAQACKLEPDVQMNPILLKPNSETGSQVIVLGQAVRNMEVADYIRYKQEAVQKACQAYDNLSRQARVMVLEGAGSPAEINLKAHDLTNMAMARHAQANVLLVGDIDRGGVFASFVGTMELLEHWEQDLLCGFVVNKFRGRKNLLDPALDFTLQRTGRPVLGVIPYLPDLGLPEEDSVSFKSGWDKNRKSHGPDCVHIACIDLAHISNFTDLEPLLPEPDVRLSIVKNAQELQEPPDLLILPGSKSVLSDIAFLRKTGLEGRIKELAQGNNTQILGICGGFQMLGQTVADPLRVESSQESLPGLGLLPLVTEMGPDKTLVQAEARHLPSGLNLRGYEIHHGLTRTTGQDAIPVVQTPQGRQLGYAHARRPIWGTYLHGLFDADYFRRWLLDELRRNKGLQPLEQPQTSYNLESQLDLLADNVRSHLDLSFIYRKLNLL